MDYLGHIVTYSGVSIDLAKIQAIIDWPEPTSLKGVCGFLGLIRYYKNFISGFGGIAAGLTKLVTKRRCQWTSKAAKSFTRLKQALTMPLVLCLPNFTLPFMVESDACGERIGAILIQQGRPMAYFSEALKRSFSIYL